MTRFEDRVVIVTGGASGIGAATVKRLLDDGARVVAADQHTPDLPEILGGSVDPKRVIAVAVDVTDRGEVEELVSRTERELAAPYGLVNCAGVRGVGTILDLEADALERVLAVNLIGTLNTCQAFARSVVSRGEPGAIVNLTSSAGIRAVPNRLSYVASKFGVAGVSITMALELADRGIRVNAIAPGMIRTPMTAPMFADPENAARISAAHPVGRAGEPREIAAVTAFLLSDDASFLTGAIIPVDGGSTAGIPSH